MNKTYKLFGKIAFLFLVLVLLGIMSVSGNLNINSEIIQCYEKNNVECCWQDNNDGTKHLGCDMSNIKANTLNNGFSTSGNYQEYILDDNHIQILNPESEIIFGLRKLHEYLRNIYVADESLQWEESKPETDFN